MELKERIARYDKLKERIKYSLNNRYREFYKNGYGVSIVPDFNDIDLYEIAVLKGTEEEYELCFDTYITNDVIKGLTLIEAHTIAKEISEIKEENKRSC